MYHQLASHIQIIMHVPFAKSILLKIFSGHGNNIFLERGPQKFFHLKRVKKLSFELKLIEARVF